MRSALLHIVSGAKPKRDGFGVWRDMKLMEKAMKGMGTDDERLVYRYVNVPVPN
jgi:annexin A7/11